MQGQLLHLFLPHDLRVLGQQFHQFPGAQLLLLLGLLILPTQAQFQAAGGMHGLHKAVHVAHPPLAGMNLGADLLADGIGQNILKQFPLLIADKALLYLGVLPQFLQQFLEFDICAPVFAHNVNSTHGDLNCLLSLFFLLKKRLQSELKVHQISPVLMISRLQAAQQIRLLSGSGLSPLLRGRGCIRAIALLRI